MPINSKQKGGQFERKIANLLSARFELITGIKQSFRRNPDSGSFFGASNQFRKETHDLDHANFGDLMCPKAFNYSIECKHYKTGPSFAAIVKGKITQWDTWIAQAKQDAINSKKAMLLIIKYNGVDEIVFLSTPVDNVPMLFPYKDVFGYRLDDLLLLDDEFFFSVDTD